jgi:hypothetical protein
VGGVPTDSRVVGDVENSALHPQPVDRDSFNDSGVLESYPQFSHPYCLYLSNIKLLSL